MKIVGGEETIKLENFDRVLPILNNSLNTHTEHWVAMQTKIKTEFFLSFRKISDLNKELFTIDNLQSHYPGK